MRASFPQADVFGGYHSASARRSPYGQFTEGQPIRESAAAAARFESRTKLTVQTAEGDRVTISLRARSELAANSQSGPNGSSLQFSSSSNSQSRITVQGELSDAELQDLTKLINTLTAVTSGADVENLVKSLPQFETLTGFQYSQRQTLQAGALFRF